MQEDYSLKGAAKRKLVHKATSVKSIKEKIKNKTLIILFNKSSIFIKFSVKIKQSSGCS